MINCEQTQLEKTKKNMQILTTSISILALSGAVCCILATVLKQQSSRALASFSAFVLASLTAVVTSNVGFGRPLPQAQIDRGTLVIPRVFLTNQYSTVAVLEDRKGKQFFVELDTDTALEEGRVYEVRGREKKVFYPLGR
jgi:hypothetical protein